MKTILIYSGEFHCQCKSNRGRDSKKCQICRNSFQTRSELGSVQVDWSDFDHKFHPGLMLQRPPAECAGLLRRAPQPAAGVQGAGAAVLQMRLRGQAGDAHSRGLRCRVHTSSLVIVIYSDQYLLWPCPGDFSF